MAKFRFSLDVLLKARRLAEQGHQRTVAQIERERFDLEDALRTLQINIADGKQSLKRGLIGTVDTENLRLHAAASMQLMRKARSTVLALAGVHRRLDAARAELIEAARRRRAVELLRERRLEQWNVDEHRREVNALDELAVSAASRRRAGDAIHMELSP